MLASPQLVAMRASAETVLVWLDSMNRTFGPTEPIYYYVSANCTGAPMMYVDLFRVGYVSNGQLYYPSGPATSQPYGSWMESGFCSPAEGSVATFAAMGQMSVTNLQAPFTVR